MENLPILRIRVNASSKYDVLIGNGLLSQVGNVLTPVIPKCKIAVITDDTVDKLYSSTVITSIENAGYTTAKFVFPHGEKSKNLNTYGDMLNFLAENEFTRTDAVVALGGGVVGDMAGFAASTYLRGIKYVQIPTTLLAQIDSSVGGKTAIDLKAGKNLVGAFCQPSAVICDVDALKTLPKDIFNDGMGEVAKYTVLDKRIFQLCKNKDRLLNELIYLCVDYKRMIVEEDEFEGGKRRLLNLGHTPAHGIEQLSDYQIPHGKAVMMGLEIILNASLKHGYIDQKTFEELKAVVSSCAPVQSSTYKIEDICKACLSDKKRSGNTITLVMVYGIGDCRPVKVNVEELKEYLS
jgi:3-dehydroquinate synthase